MSEIDPNQTSASWRVQKPGKRPQKIEQIAFVRGWSPLNNSKVCPPHEVEFVEPWQIPKLSNQIFQRWRVKNLITVTGIGIVSVGMAIHILVNGFDQTRLTMLAVLLLGLVLFSTAYWTVSSQELLVSQSRYLSSTYESFMKKNIACYLLLAASLLLHYRGWDDDALQSTWWAFGTVLQEVNSGEYWRLIVGPLIHGNTFHLLGNYLLMVVLFPVAYGALKSTAFWVIIAGAIISHLGYVVLSNTGISPGADALLGISGGTYALLGAIISTVIFRGEVFPPRFAYYIVAYSIFLFAATELMAQKVSSVAHVLGLITGFAMGAIYLKFVAPRNALDSLPSEAPH